MWLAAMDDRINLAVISGYLHSYYESMFHSHLCCCNYFPCLLYTSSADLYLTDGDSGYGNRTDNLPVSLFTEIFCKGTYGRRSKRISGNIRHARYFI